MRFIHHIMVAVACLCVGVPASSAPEGKGGKGGGHCMKDNKRHKVKAKSLDERKAACAEAGGEWKFGKKHRAAEQAKSAPAEAPPEGDGRRSRLACPRYPKFWLALV